MIWNVTLSQQLIYEETIQAESEEEAVQIAMEVCDCDDMNWRRAAPKEVVCVEPRDTPSVIYGMSHAELEDLNSCLEDMIFDQLDGEEGPEWDLD